VLPSDAPRQAEDGFYRRDISYFRDAQYATPNNLNVRVALHAKYSTAIREWFDWLTDQIDWSDSREVLEVGCGTGLFWRHVPATVGRHLAVTLTDLSQEMVNTATVRARSRTGELQGFVADVHRLPFPDDSFDMVIANHMLYHSPNPSSALREIARVLRPGGTLMASTNGPGHLEELYAVDATVFGSSSARNNNALVFGSISGIDLLQEHFEETVWRRYEDVLLCTEADDVVAYLTSVPPGETATPQQLAALNAEVRGRMSGGVFVVSKNTGVFIAKKLGA
jgi:SAM-dependent methyltransferase